MVIKHNGGAAAPPNSSVTQTYVAHLIWNKLSSTYSSNHRRAGPPNSAGGSSISHERYLNSVSIAPWTEFMETKHRSFIWNSAVRRCSVILLKKKKKKSIISGLLANLLLPKIIETVGKRQQEAQFIPSPFVLITCFQRWAFWVERRSERRTRSLCN